MSNFLAIATVTATLKDFLQITAARDVKDHEVVVTTLRPDISKGDGQDAKATINIYLYQVTPNAAWRNADLPTRRADGTLLQHPLAALDLHYMISFYGNESQLVSQRLLGSVVRTFHAQPFLTRERIRHTVNPPPAPGSQPGNETFPFLAESNLAEQVELVKFSPLHLSLEELSKIWSVFFQIPYVLSVAYQGTVVLIESDDIPEAVLPVQGRNIYAVPFHQPVIEQITVKPEANQPIIASRPITVDKPLLILGKRLQGGKGTLVQIGGIEVTPQPADVTDTQITLLFDTLVRLPDDTDAPLASQLRAGVQGMQVIHRKQMGMDKDKDQVNWHHAVESNVVAFVLRPIVTDAKGDVAGEVTVILKPGIRRGQKVVLLLNELRPAQQPPRTYTFTMNSRTQIWKDQAGKEVTDPSKLSHEDATDTIKFAITGVGAGTYLVRVQVDGAESPLDVDTNPGSPTFNMYTGTPQVKIP